MPEKTWFQSPLIDVNDAVQDRRARKYDQRHGEIFNPIEQSLLKEALLRAQAEAQVAHWVKEPVLEEFYRAGIRFDWRKYLTPSNYVHNLIRFFKPRHTNEGDIHVWPDDHIDWDQIIAIMAQRGLEPVIDDAFLLFRTIYRVDVFEAYPERCVDMGSIAFRKGLVCIA